MLFPSTQSEFRVRNLPWMSALLVLVCGVVFVSSPRELPTPDSDVRDPLGEASQFWQQHAYLDPTPEILARVEGEIASHRRPLINAAIRELGWRSMPPDAASRDRQRSELDRLIVEIHTGEKARNPLPAGHVFRRYGFSPSEPSAFTALTHLFLHADWLHFLSMAGLLFFLAANLEDRWGSLATGIFFLLSGLFSASVLAMVETGSPMSAIGVGGPVAALLAVFALGNRTGQVRIAVLSPGIGRIRLTPFSVSALTIAATWFVVALGEIVWLREIGVRGDLSASQPLAGMLFGLVVGLIVRASGLESPYAGSELDARLKASSVSQSIDEAMVARDMGDLDRAFILLREEITHNPDDRALIPDFWEVAVATNRATDARDVMVRLVLLQLRKRDTEAACQTWIQLVDALPETRLAPDALLRMIPTLLGSDQRERALFALRQCVDLPQNELNLGISLRVLDAAENLDAEIALLAGRRALELPELHVSKRNRIMALIRELDPDSASETEPIEDSLEEAQAAPEFGDGDDSQSLEPADALEDLPSELFNEAGELEIPDDWDSHEPEYLGTVPPKAETSREDVIGVELEFDPPPDIETEDPELTISPHAIAPPPTPGGDDATIARIEAGRDLASSPIVQRPRPVPVPIDLSSLPRFDGISVLNAVPAQLTESALYFRLKNQRRAKVPYDEIQAIGVAALRDLASKPVVIIDLLLNWTELGEAPLRSIRLRSDHFDPRSLVEGNESPSESLRHFLAELAARSGTILLPDAGAAVGRPFRVYKFLSAYHRRVLKIDC
jgi:membrane associated rhomboid family serine protease